MTATNQISGLRVDDSCRGGLISTATILQLQCFGQLSRLCDRRPVSKEEPGLPLIASRRSLGACIGTKSAFSIRMSVPSVIAHARDPARFVERASSLDGA